MPKTKVTEKHAHPDYPRLVIDRRTNSRFYQARTFFEGKLLQKSTRTTEFQTALRIAADWYRRLCRESDSRARPHPVKLTDPTFPELFRSHRSGLQAGKRAYADMRWGPIRGFWRSVRLTEIGPEKIREFYRWRRQHGHITNSTLHKDVALLRNVLNHALDLEALEHLPRFPRIGEVKSNPRPWLTQNEYQQLVKTAIKRVTSAPNQRVRRQRQDVLDTFRFLIASMLRVGELRQLRFADCREDATTDGKKKILFCEVTGKRGTRTVVAFQDALQIYERRRKGQQRDSLIFPRHCRDGFRELLDAAHLRTDKFGFTRNLKSMRATAISFMLVENPVLNLAAVARNAGTSVEMIDNFYAKRLTAEMFKDSLVSKPNLKGPLHGLKDAALLRLRIHEQEMADRSNMEPWEGQEEDEFENREGD